jgi:hypothetical protein
LLRVRPPHSPHPWADLSAMLYIRDFLDEASARQQLLFLILVLLSEEQPYIGLT